MMLSHLDANGLELTSENLVVAFHALKEKLILSDGIVTSGSTTVVDCAAPPER
jgi:hypothetical protein